VPDIPLRRQSFHSAGMMFPEILKKMPSAPQGPSARAGIVRPAEIILFCGFSIHTVRSTSEIDSRFSRN